MFKLHNFFDKSEAEVIIRNALAFNTSDTKLRRSLTISNLTAGAPSPLHLISAMAARLLLLSFHLPPATAVLTTVALLCCADVVSVPSMERIRTNENAWDYTPVAQALKERIVALLGIRPYHDEYTEAIQVGQPLGRLELSGRGRSLISSLDGPLLLLLLLLVVVLVQVLRYNKSTGYGLHHDTFDYEEDSSLDPAAGGTNR